MGQMPAGNQIISNQVDIFVGDKKSRHDAYVERTALDKAAILENGGVERMKKFLHHSPFVDADDGVLFVDALNLF